MADQTAHVTLTLTDEMSDGIATITRQFEGLQRTIRDTTRRSDESFKQSAEEVAKYAESLGKIGERLRNIPKEVQEPLAAMQRALGNIPQLLSIFERQGASTTAVLGGMATALGRVALGAGGVSTGILGVAGATGALLNRMIEANNAVQNLQTNLRTNTDTTVVAIQRLYASVGSSGEVALQQVKQWNELYQELSKGNQAALAQTLLKHEGGKEVLDQFNKSLREGKDGATAYKEMLEFIARQPTRTAIELLKELHLNVADTIHAAERLRAEGGLPKVWGPTAQEARDYATNLETISRAYNQLADTIDDFWRKNREGIAQFGADFTLWIRQQLRDLNALFNTPLKDMDWRYLLQRFKQTAGGDFGASEEVKVEEGIEILKRAYGAQGTAERDRLHPGRVGGQPRPVQPRDDDVQKFYNEWPGAAPRLQRQSYIGGGERGSRPFQFISYSPDQEATGRGDVREIKDTNKESTAYLRQMTDTLLWIRHQMESAGIGAGGGGGGGGPQVTNAAYTTRGGSFAAATRMGTNPLQSHGGVQLPDAMPDVGAAARSAGGRGDPRGLESYIRAQAAANGVDPDVAMRVARSEGLGVFSGDRGTSFTAFQLHTGGGLGDVFKRATGLDPSDPANERAAIAWTMQHVGQTHDWSPWHGAARVGVGRHEGFGYHGGPGGHVSQETPQGPAGDPAVPGDILARAREVALTSGPAGVERFMRAQGYPRAGNWCGEFAASVVKSAGYKPPQNPAIASNWRRFGTVDPVPHPGDIAVRRGVATGSTGSHVTIVEAVHGGRFTGLGGNQRAGFESNFPVGGYEFRRPPGGGGLAHGMVDPHAIDRHIGAPSTSGHLGTAHVHVSFDNLPRNARTRARSSGVFKNLRVAHTPAMNTTGSHGPDDSNLYASEVG